MKFILVLALLALVSCGKNDDAPVIHAIKAKDPVCGMWVEKRPAPISIVVVFDKALYYFCADECSKEFAANPLKFTQICNCKDAGRSNCKCEHCEGKAEPCDCRK